MGHGSLSLKSLRRRVGLCAFVVAGTCRHHRLAAADVVSEGSARSVQTTRSLEEVARHFRVGIFGNREVTGPSRAGSSIVFVFMLMFIFVFVLVFVCVCGCDLRIKGKLRKCVCVCVEHAHAHIGRQARTQARPHGHMYARTHARTHEAHQRIEGSRQVLSQSRNVSDRLP